MDVELLSQHPVDAARALLGVEVRTADVSVRIVEVEAYGGPDGGPWPDSAAHSYRGPTPRNSVMFGPAGRLYVYLSYGMHLCLNVTCGPDGEAAAVLLRAAEVVDGLDVVRTRRSPSAIGDRIASGPGNLGQALGVSLGDNGTDLFDATASIRLLEATTAPSAVSEGPRVGVTTAAEKPWRFWLPGSPAVSAYRRSPRAPRRP
ncbi:DNA-3-methyladenine glycosylase [Rhodococcus sp. G-MC3]|uniref:DNA-3-methyladenine glycosylase n=1 Tax=Rhodococcus sp. G-MC3 TaxID=3046209 RepID=UPI0024BA32BC|nr:DNA-3-methyladenine glycosylase [Rhodococcus sp. G-MC3]MDJ0393213.1 DNA-3-methyladenine glycosylase [Rhodococcus sp. G-MC3]